MATFCLNYGIANNENVEFISPTNYENEILDSLNDSYKTISEMSQDERQFLNAVILRNKPRKLVELGVSSGGSSIVILNAIKDIPNARLYSVDLNESWYRSNGKKTGYFVEKYSNLKPKWELCTGGFVSQFIDKIGNEIDFCLIDTAHYNPGEIFDFLMILPYLKDNAMIVFHDINYHTTFHTRDGITNNLLMSSIVGKKILQENSQTIFSNIGGVKIDSETRKNVYGIFNLLTIQWCYLPTDSQEEEIVTFCDKHYDVYYVEYVKNVFAYQRKMMWERRKKDKIKLLVKKAVGEKNIAFLKKILK